MATPVLVREYPSSRMPLLRSRTSAKDVLPPISSYAFADILRAADGPTFQTAIDGIAEICAKNRMSLADEYGSHIQPLGTITTPTSSTVRPPPLRPGMRRALTAVPEGSSGSSEGSRQSKKKRTGLFGFGRRQTGRQEQSTRTIRIGSMGRTISVGGTTALATTEPIQEDSVDLFATARHDSAPQPAALPVRRPSQAESSLQRLLEQNTRLEAG